MIQLVVLSLLATAAVQGKYPTQVSIQVGNYHICGGTILNKNTVLTAAHCFANMRNTDRLRVVTSTVNLRQPGCRYKVAKHNSGRNADILKEVEQQVLEYQPCSRIVGQIYSTQFCIIYPGYGKGICEGDSGGPVFQDGRQIGIISWRDGNGQCGRAPAVATLVSRYVDWIKSNM
ncbi:hypothetical protein B566_EDAN013260 [Ephemera danica]|nr:hypothetical protein B566_EDAN013260 [Ephemera danica]